MYQQDPSISNKILPGLIGRIDRQEGAQSNAQEIPAQIDSVGYSLGETITLLSALHQKLAAVMPPSAPQACDTLSNTNLQPSTPLGNQLAEFARIAQQNNASLRYLLDSIKL